MNKLINQLPYLSLINQGLQYFKALRHYNEYDASKNILCVNVLISHELIIYMKAALEAGTSGAAP